MEGTHSLDRAFEVICPLSGTACPKQPIPLERLLSTQLPTVVVRQISLNVEDLGQNVSNAFDGVFLEAADLLGDLGKLSRVST